MEVKVPGGDGDYTTPTEVRVGDVVKVAKKRIASWIWLLPSGGSERSIKVSDVVLVAI